MLKAEDDEQIRKAYLDEGRSIRHISRELHHCRRRRMQRENAQT